MSSGGGVQSLNDLVAKPSSYCLNEDPKHSFANLFQGDHTLFLKSDADEQLILQISFHQTVFLRTVQLGLPNDDSCPNTVKVFVNQMNLGFSDAPGIPFSNPIIR